MDYWNLFTFSNNYTEENTSQEFQKCKNKLCLMKKPKVKIYNPIKLNQYNNYLMPFRDGIIIKTKYIKPREACRSGTVHSITIKIMDHVLMV